MDISPWYSNQGMFRSNFFITHNQGVISYESYESYVMIHRQCRQLTNVKKDSNIQSIESRKNPRTIYGEILWMKDNSCR